METQLSLLPPQVDEGFPAFDATTDPQFGTLFTRRLRRLIAIRRDHSTRMNDHGLRLLDRAIFSTYCDCIDLGVGAEGLRVLQK